MSFSNPGPVGGYAVGATLTSAQLNSAFSYIANALDKSTAGDELLGVVTMASTAQIDVNTPGAAIVSTVQNGIYSNAAKGIVAATGQAIASESAGGITSTTRGGITPGVAGGITDGGVAQGIQATVAQGICDGGVVGGITATVAGGIESTVATGILTTANAGLALGGGSNDWPTFANVSGTIPRSRSSTARFMNARALAAGWTIYTTSFPILPFPVLVGPATTALQAVPLDFLHHGATLNSLAFVFAVGASHTGVPAQLPQFSIYRSPLAIGASAYSSSVALSTTAAQSPATPGSGSIWYDSGVNQQMVYGCNQANVIDTTQYAYFAVIEDENSTNAIAGNLYIAMIPNYVNILNMAFP
jgi:hypothetical protein